MILSIHWLTLCSSQLGIGIASDWRLELCHEKKALLETFKLEEMDDVFSMMFTVDWDFLWLFYNWCLGKPAVRNYSYCSPVGLKGMLRSHRSTKSSDFSCQQSLTTSERDLTGQVFVSLTCLKALNQLMKTSCGHDVEPGDHPKMALNFLFPWAMDRNHASQSPVVLSGFRKPGAARSNLIKLLNFCPWICSSTSPNKSLQKVL